MGCLFVDGFHRCAKKFYSDVVPFVYFFPFLRRLIDSEQTDSSCGGGGLGRGGIEGKIKRALGQRQQCGGCRGRAWVDVAEGVRGVNGNGKNTIKSNSC